MKFFTKKCPHCSKEILYSAKVCLYCNNEVKMSNVVNWVIVFMAAGVSSLYYLWFIFDRM